MDRSTCYKKNPGIIRESKHSAILGFPIVKGGFTYVMLPANLFYCST